MMSNIICCTLGGIGMIEGSTGPIDVAITEGYVTLPRATIPTLTALQKFRVTRPCYASIRRRTIKIPDIVTILGKSTSQAKSEAERTKGDGRM